MHMQNLSSMGVLDAPVLMHRFVITVSLLVYTHDRVSSMQRVKLENYILYCYHLYVLYTCSMLTFTEINYMSSGYGLTPFHLIYNSCFSHPKFTLKIRKWEKQEYTILTISFMGFFTSQSAATVMSGRSVHLTKLEQAVTSTSCT